jgi:hypothetical protein
MLAELAYVRKPAANLIAKVKIHTLPACLVDVTEYANRPDAPLSMHFRRFTRTAMSGTQILLRKSNQFQFITTHVCGGNKSKRKPFFCAATAHSFISFSSK